MKKVFICECCGTVFEKTSDLTENVEPCCEDNTYWHWADEDADGDMIFVNPKTNATSIDPTENTRAR